MTKKRQELTDKIVKTLMSEGLRYHLDNSVSFNDNIFRPGSKEFFRVLREARKLYNAGLIEILQQDLEIMRHDIGEWAIYKGKHVPLDLPLSEESDILFEKSKSKGTLYKGRKVKLNKPKRGGSKKFYVYVRDPKTKNIRRIEFGQKGMETGLRDPKRSKSFEKRHRCEDKNDKTKPGYWACRIGRYPKITGAPYRRWW